METLASIGIQSTGSFLYSQLLKITQHYDQPTLGAIAVLKDVGVNFRVFSRVLYSYFATSGSTYFTTSGWVLD
ncbi:hypothetical protein PanWU01x14_141110 [Parasponia andersonii]|uniref:Uncharacterized protein n=1 Tax=Parasponia andersonii TaxID=3476 RepID=A0A2P5CM47_PARAD|nr:hypothetical protein PanWU01x14_141110 [Parasponia andersonii]